MSMTKQFTAAAILKLEMMGELSVDDPITEHLDGVPRDKREITIAQLLNHSSGLIDALGDDYEPIARDRMLAGAFKSELQSRPGAEYSYSNLGYSVLAALIEEVSGESYEEFLSQNLFEPAGMAATGYVLPDWDTEQVAVEYDAGGASQGRPFDHPWADDGPYWNLRGNGGMLSTARAYTSGTWRWWARRSSTKRRRESCSNRGCPKSLVATPIQGSGGWCRTPSSAGSLGTMAAMAGRSDS